MIAIVFNILFDFYIYFHNNDTVKVANISKGRVSIKSNGETVLNPKTFSYIRNRWEVRTKRKKS